MGKITFAGVRLILLSSEMVLRLRQFGSGREAPA